MSKKCWCYDDWEYSKHTRRDFRQDHGGGPEIIPGRSLKRKKGCPKGGDHHWEVRAAVMHWSDYAEEMIESFTGRINYCSKCSKREWINNKKSKGCPGNNGKSHLYVWIEYITKSYGREAYRVYRMRCIGCDRDNGKRVYNKPPANIYETRIEDWK